MVCVWGRLGHSGQVRMIENSSRVLVMRKHKEHHHYLSIQINRVNYPLLQEVYTNYSICSAIRLQYCSVSTEHFKSTITK